MYLKRLELQGFKSFPDKIRLEFNKGITAIVGPNGSGKSNISDAIRWVLGEQSAKSLRGGKMEDIIFAGTQARRAVGFAEVSMIIDNSDKNMKLDYTEITVTRRVYRSGESEFMINGTNCRLKDIHEMFMDTGVGREGYSIIGQGRIQEILNARSEDKRLLFEEATGIAKFKSRKSETNVKLDRERENLVRVNDIISELELQIEPLRNQSKVAKEYLELREKLKLLQINIFVQDVKKTEEDIAKITENINIVVKQVEENVAKQQEIERKMKELKESIKETDENLKQTNVKAGDLKSNIERKENEIKITKEQKNFADVETQRLEAEIRKKSAIVDEFKENARQENARFNSLEIQLYTKREKLKEKEKTFEALSAEMEENEQRIDKINSEIIENLKATSDIKGNIERKKSITEQLLERSKQLEEEQMFNTSQINDKEIKVKALEVNLRNCDGEIEEIEKEKGNLEKEEIENNRQKDKKRSEFDTTNKTKNNYIARHKLLNELEQSYEGYYRSVKSILKKKSSGDERFKGVCGVVAELINVPKKLETSIEIALGSSLQNIVTEKEADAKIAIEYLKSTKEGRATFLPISTITAKDLGNVRDKILGEEGVLGIAAELVGFDSMYRNIFFNLLGRIIIVDNINNGLKVFKKYNYVYRIVTLEGEVLNPGGSMTGGSINQKSGNILSRSREIKELKDEIEALSKKESVIKGEIEKIIEQIRMIKEKIKSLDDKKLDIEKEKIMLEHSKEQTKVQLGQIVEKNNLLISEKEQLQVELERSSEKLKEYELKLLKREEKIAEIQNALEEYQVNISTSKEEKESRVRQLTEIKIEVSQIEQSIEGVQNELKWISEQILISGNEIKDFEEGIKKKEAEKTQKLEIIKKYEKEIEQIKKQQEEEAKRLNIFENLKQSMVESQEKISVEEKDIYETVSKLENELTKQTFRKEQLEENNRKQYDDMWEEYKVTLKTAKESVRIEKSTEELRKDEKNTKIELQKLGNVNVNAIEEYKNVSARYEFLINQRNDILEAEKKLLEIIEELTELMKQQFTNQFSIISENFAKVFSEMFGGGTAFLQLKDSTKPLESSIDIVAKPPGKNLQSMSLLSGGELALTATALLFGILRMKPSPFCILDEVEAALDDANVRRYANFIRNFSHETQFILITHRKGTMECADVLYGVTMQEHGVSKLVSAKLTDEIMAN